MNLFALSGLLSGIAGTVMAGLVYFTNRPGRVNRLWAIFCLAVSLWGFGGLLIGLTHDPDVALTWWRIAHVGVILIPVLFYHFVTAFADVRRPIGLTFAYVGAAAFLLANASPLLIANVRRVFGQFYYNSSPGILYLPFLAFFVGLLLLSHVELWRCLRRTKQREQRLLFRWFLVGTTIGFSGGMTCFLPVFGLDLYPYGNFAIPFFPLLMAYAFLRYRLMDVNRAVARGTTFLVIYAFVVGIPFVVGRVYRPVWEAVLGDWWWAAPVVLMGLSASASPIVFLFLVRRLEHRLLQAQRRYHRTLIVASSGMTRIKDIQTLCRLIVYIVNRTVGLSHTGLFLYEPKEQRYALRATRYRSMLPGALVVEQTDPLIQILQQEQDLVVAEELVGEKAPKGSPEALRQRSRVYAWMRTLEVKLIVPSFSDSRLLAFLILGAKRSGEPYTTDDIAVFSGLANQAALAIENAMFFEELRNNEAYIIQSEKLASLGQLASGMAHEIHNPLTIISGEAQLYLERFKGQHGEADGVFKSIIEECQRAADITRRILRFAKPAPTDVVPLDLKVTVEETLTLAGYQVKMEQVERIVQVPTDLPKVRGNQNQLQEVILNLILNACQAMGERGGRLEVRASAVNGSSVQLQVADTGPGIPSSKLRKIFDPFYTTKSTGTGLGLFVSQRIVRAHGGTIDVQSTEGKGTCFTIRLPVWQEEKTSAVGSAA